MTRYSSTATTTVVPISTAVSRSRERRPGSGRPARGGPRAWSSRHSCDRNGGHRRARRMRARDVGPCARYGDRGAGRGGAPIDIEEGGSMIKELRDFLFQGNVVDARRRGGHRRGVRRGRRHRSSTDLITPLLGLLRLPDFSTWTIKRQRRRPAGGAQAGRVHQRRHQLRGHRGHRDLLLRGQADARPSRPARSRKRLRPPARPRSSS